MRSEKIYIILVSYGNADLTIACVKSIYAKPKDNIKTIIVDNCSPDNTVEILKRELKGMATIIQSNENKGFSYGNNIGIKYALKHEADYIMFLNNDTEIAPNMIECLIENCNRETVCAPKMMYYDKPNLIWFAGGKYLTLSGRYIHVGENELDSSLYSQAIDCDFLTGCCMMFSAQTVRDVGLMSEEYFMYEEDVDYSLRLLKKKVKLKMIPEAKLWHKVGATSGQKSKRSIYYGNRNRLYINKKFKKSTIIKMITLFSRVLLAIKGTILNTNEKVIWKAIYDYYKMNMGKTFD